MERYFFPIDPLWQEIKCNQLKLKRISNHPEAESPQLLNRPRERHSIRGDGNCFFRCIAYALTGNEEEHLVVREAVLSFMMNEGDAA